MHNTSEVLSLQSMKSTELGAATSSFSKLDPEIILTVRDLISLEINMKMQDEKEKDRLYKDK